MQVISGLPQLQESKHTEKLDFFALFNEVCDFKTLLFQKRQKGKFSVNKLYSKTALHLTKIFHYTKSSFYENKNTVF